MLLFLISLSVFYIFPALIAYLGIRHMYKTEYNMLQPELDDFLMVFVPLLNWGMAIYILMSFLFDGIDEIADSATKVDKKIRDRNIGDKFFKL